MRHSGDEAPAGMARLLRRRARRIPATYLLGRDGSAALVPRIAARLLSAYERAPLRALLAVLDLDTWFVDDPILWLARRIIFATAGRPRGDDDTRLDFEVLNSGWRGSLFALAIWSTAIACGIWLWRSLLQ